MSEWFQNLKLNKKRFLQQIGPNYISSFREDEKADDEEEEGDGYVEKLILIFCLFVYSFHSIRPTVL